MLSTTYYHQVIRKKQNKKREKTRRDRTRRQDQDYDNTMAAPKGYTKGVNWNLKTTSLTAVALLAGAAGIVTWALAYLKDPYQTTTKTNSKGEKETVPAYTKMDFITGLAFALILLAFICLLLLFVFLKSFVCKDAAGNIASDYEPHTTYNLPGPAVGLATIILLFLGGFFFQLFGFWLRAKPENGSNLESRKNFSTAALVLLSASWLIFLLFGFIYQPIRCLKTLGSF